LERLSLTLWYHGAASVSRGLYWDNVWEMEGELGKEEWRSKESYSMEDTERAG